MPNSASPTFGRTPAPPRRAFGCPTATRVTLRLQVPGLHNLRNATAALGVVHALGGPLAPALEALAEFGGVGRRFERLGEAGGVTLVDDYAHHPTELVATLEAARQAFPGRRLVAVFQPHLFSRTEAAWRGHGGGPRGGRSGGGHGDLRRAGKAGARGERTRGGGRRAGRPGPMSHFAPGSRHRGAAGPGPPAAGDVVLTLGAGDITRLGPELAAWLRAA